MRYAVIRYPMEYALIDHLQPVADGAGKIISWHRSREAAWRKADKLEKQHKLAKTA